MRKAEVALESEGQRSGRLAVKEVGMGALKGWSKITGSMRRRVERRRGWKVESWTL